MNSSKVMHVMGVAAVLLGSVVFASTLLRGGASEADTFTGSRSENSGVTASTAQGSAVMQSVAASSALRRPATDFDGDGRSELVLQDVHNGFFAYWGMAGADAVSYSPAFRFGLAGRGMFIDDYNGDGRADVFAEDDPDGDDTLTSVFVVQPQPDGTVRPALVGLLPDDLKVRATGDIDADGKADLVHFDGRSVVYWIMNGTTVIRKSGFIEAPARHSLMTTGDFDGDGRLDIVWQANDTRALLMWVGDGTGFKPVAVRDLAAGWQVWGAGDIDGDGRSDLLLTNPSFRFFAYWTMDGARPVRYSPAFVLPGEGLLNRFGPVTVGDYNADGKLDVVLSRERDQRLVMWLGDGTGFIERPMRQHTAGWRVERRFRLPGAPVRAYVEGDADGDGQSDVLAIDPVSTDAGIVWADKNESVRFPAPRASARIVTNPGLGGQPLASGDFDGDGRVDLVIERRDPVRAAVRTIMRLSSGFPAAEVEIPTPIGTWRIFGAGDVDGDGLSDLLLGEGLDSGLDVTGPNYRNPSMRGFAYWVMNRNEVLRYSIGFQTDPLAARLGARGDFDGDGRLDLVWTSLTGASTAMATMWIGAGEGFSVAPMTAPAAGWVVIAGGDVNGDRKSEIFLQNPDGIAYWQMDGARIASFSPGFLIRRVWMLGDINGDQRIDLLAPGTASGQTTIAFYYGDGAGFRYGGFARVGQACTNVFGCPDSIYPGLFSR